ncbi:MAG TPA: hypothetical protein VH985_13700 [Candidatus Binatia bacterium]
MIKRNEREGAPLDQRWYGFRRFGPTLEQFLRAREVRFYGGRETDIRSALAGQYISLIPYEADQDPGEIRLFTGWRENGDSDLIMIGQNGREVALKTVIRLAYLFRFMDQRTQQTFVGGLDAFLRKVRIFLSALPPREEFISFFRRYNIADPDVVLIGFQRDARSYLEEVGIGDPERYSTDSLRINWYPNANGRKLLLVSINGNRIFASRAGELLEAMFQTFHSPPQSLVFFGSAGAIDSPDLLGRVVAPTVVANDDPFDSDRRRGKLAYIIHNRAAMILPVKSAHTSVESLVAETTSWAAANKKNRIMTVDQELYHVVEAINASPYGARIRLFVGMLVTDNVSSVQAQGAATLQQAEDIIADTAGLRRRFFARVLSEVGMTAQSVTTRTNTAINE